MNRKEQIIVARDAANLGVYREPAVAAYYASLDYLSPCEQLLFEKFILRGTEVLDIGVGGGRTTPYLSRIASEYLGVDYSEEMVRSCRDKFPNLEFQVADAADLSFLQDGSFGAVVIAFNGLDYVVPEARRRQCLQECFRVLRAGGVLIFSSHNPRSVLVRPAWSRERLQSFAAKLAGERQAWVAPITRLLTPLKATHSLARAAGASAERILTRMSRAPFWRGEGYDVDPVHGGLLTHYWTPRKAICEVSGSGFVLCACVGDDFPHTSTTIITDWYYYVFSKGDRLMGSKPCA
jgi:ubiquinone/menaquinone biosynthesis C-methylase UbiE